MAKSSRPTPPTTEEKPVENLAEPVTAEPVAQETPQSEEPAEAPAGKADTEAMMPPESAPAIIQEEPVRETAAEPAAEVEKPMAEPPQTVREIRVERRGGFLGVFAGGVLAAAAGYAVATYYPLFPPAQDDGSLASLTAAQETQAKQIGAAEAALKGLTDRLVTLENAPAAEPTAAPAVDLGPLESAVQALSARIDAIEALPAGEGEGASNAAVAAAIEQLKTEVNALKGEGAAATETIQAMADEAAARLAEAEAQAAQLKAEAEEVARNARQAAALGRVQAAMESGAPYAQALADVEGVEPSAALTRYAETGVPTLAALAATFPPAAREALELSRRATVGDGLGDRVAAFLENATGARSLAPREGDDPDAVLSRAEAAVKAGDLPAALTEIKLLPAEGQAPLAAWVAEVEGRLAAIDAVMALSAQIAG